MSVKQEAIKTLNFLPETATWDDAMYALYIKQQVAEGLNDVREGNILSHEEVGRRLFGDAR